MAPQRFWPCPCRWTSQGRQSGHIARVSLSLPVLLSAPHIVGEVEDREPAVQFLGRGVVRDRGFDRRIELAQVHLLASRLDTGEPRVRAGPLRPLRLNIT